MKTDLVRAKLGNLTQKQFAELLNVNVRKVTNWDARETFPVWLEVLILKYVVPSLDRDMIQPDENLDGLPYYDVIHPRLEDIPSEYFFTVHKGEWIIQCYQNPTGCGCYVYRVIDRCGFSKVIDRVELGVFLGSGGLARLEEEGYNAKGE